jgi:hypothetical protein
MRAGEPTIVEGYTFGATMLRSSFDVGEGGKVLAGLGYS